MRTSILLGLIWSGSALASGDPPWASLELGPEWKEVAVRSADIGEVRVLHREIGDVHCLQGITRTTVTPDALLAPVLDVPSALAWTSAPLVASEELGRTDSHVDLYQYLDVPNWTLVADRYWILRGTPSALDQGGKRFRWQRIDAKALYPDVLGRVAERNANAIEPPTNWGEWRFEPQGDHTQVVYRVCTDIGGSIPSGIQRWVATRTLPDTVADLVREAARRTESAAPTR